MFKWKQKNTKLSLSLLFGKKILNKIYHGHIKQGWNIANIDSTIILQTPTIKPYIKEIKENIYNACFTCGGNVSIKATTTDHLGFIGEKKGIAVISTCLLIRDND